MKRNFAKTLICLLAAALLFAGAALGGARTYAAESVLVVEKVAVCGVEVPEFYAGNALIPSDFSSIGQYLEKSDAQLNLQEIIWLKAEAGEEESTEQKVPEKADYEETEDDVFEKGSAYGLRLSFTLADKTAVFAVKPEVLIYDSDEEAPELLKDLKAENILTDGSKISFDLYFGAVEDELTEIEKIEIEGVTDPKTGAEPEQPADYEKKNAYQVKFDADGWDGTFDSDDTFKAGETYTLGVTVKAAKDCIFGKNTLVTINGKPVGTYPLKESTDLLKLTYEKKSDTEYASLKFAEKKISGSFEDGVQAELTLKTGDGKAIKNAEIQFEIKSGSTIVSDGTVTTDQNGKAEISFDSSLSEDGEEALFHVGDYKITAEFSEEGYEDAADSCSVRITGEKEETPSGVRFTLDEKDSEKGVFDGVDESMAFSFDGRNYEVFLKTAVKDGQYPVENVPDDAEYVYVIVKGNGLDTEDSEPLMIEIVREEPSSEESSSEESSEESRTEPESSETKAPETEPTTKKEEPTTAHYVPTSKEATTSAPTQKPTQTPLPTATPTTAAYSTAAPVPTSTIPVIIVTGDESEEPTEAESTEETTEEPSATIEDITTTEPEETTAPEDEDDHKLKGVKLVLIIAIVFVVAAIALAVIFYLKERKKEF